jgi:choline/glycine/proline betaine transport protein
MLTGQVATERHRDLTGLTEQQIVNDVLTQLERWRPAA